MPHILCTSPGALAKYDPSMSGLELGKNRLFCFVFSNYGTTVYNAQHNK